MTVSTRSRAWFYGSRVRVFAFTEQTSARWHWQARLFRIRSPRTRDSMTVSRINRLLRPLRNKCAILASATSRPSGSAVPITYGSNSSISSKIRAPPPLDVLHDPKLVISRAHQESRSLDTLARQIYALTNTYRNVVQAALSGRVDGSRRDVLALTDICAASIGRNIKGEVAVCLATLEGEPDEKDAKETALVDELYESVPARFRRCVIACRYINL
jgi:hypothetical protein